MEFALSKNSKDKLSLADESLQEVVSLAIKWGIIDFAVTESYRDKLTQNRYFNEGKSKIPWPNGKHNSVPSQAVDLVPVVNGKISWDSRHCLVLAGVILSAGEALGVTIRWGGNWDMDGEPVTDQDFQDLVHFEIIV